VFRFIFTSSNKTQKESNKTRKEFNKNKEEKPYHNKLLPLDNL